MSKLVLSDLGPQAKHESYIAGVLDPWYWKGLAAILLAELHCKI